MNNLLSNLISSADAAVLLNCDIRTLRRYREKGIINRQKIKGIVYYSSEDLIKLKSMNDQSSPQRKTDARIKALEDQVKALKLQVSLLTKIAGLRNDELRSINDADASRICKMLEAFNRKPKVSWAITHTWVDEVTKFSSEVIAKVGNDVVIEFLHKVATMCGLEDSDRARSLEMTVLNKLANLSEERAHPVSD